MRGVLDIGDRDFLLSFADHLVPYILTRRCPPANREDSDKSLASSTKATYLKHMQAALQATIKKKP
jgi:hypothetical protein